MSDTWYFWGEDSWHAIPVPRDVRECIGGPLDGCLIRELHPLQNVADYEPMANGDYRYRPPMILPQSPPSDRTFGVALAMTASAAAIGLAVGTLISLSLRAFQ